MSNHPSESQMRDALYRAKILCTISGMECISSLGVSLISGVPVNRINNEFKTHDPTPQKRGMHTITPSDSFWRDLRRGANEIQAHYGTNQLIPLLYKAAVDHEIIKEENK